MTEFDTRNLILPKISIFGSVYDPSRPVAVKALRTDGLRFSPDKNRTFVLSPLYGRIHAALR